MERELAAHLGDVDAMRVLDISEIEPNGFDAWAWAFSRFGKLTMARAALVAAKLAANIWEQYQPSDDFDAKLIGGPQLVDCLALANRCLQSGNTSGAELLAVARQQKLLLANVQFYVDEASGDAERVASRRRALSALSATVAMLETLTWTEEELDGSSDPTEAEARTAAGPALNVVRSFAHCCFATGLTGTQLRAALREALL